MHCRIAGGFACTLGAIIFGRLYSMQWLLDQTAGLETDPPKHDTPGTLPCANRLWRCLTAPSFAQLLETRLDTIFPPEDLCPSDNDNEQNQHHVKRVQQKNLKIFGGSFTWETEVRVIAKRWIQGDNLCREIKLESLRPFKMSLRREISEPLKKD